MFNLSVRANYTVPPKQDKARPPRGALVHMVGLSTGGGGGLYSEVYGIYIVECASSFEMEVA
jgi:hypothetical protein